MISIINYRKTTFRNFLFENISLSINQGEQTAYWAKRTGKIPFFAVPRESEPSGGEVRVNKGFYIDKLPQETVSSPINGACGLTEGEERLCALKRRRKRIEGETMRNARVTVEVLHELEGWVS
jgi:ATPase subunit of ABC transporter with duplicated ATPase domains